MLKKGFFAAKNTSMADVRDKVQAAMPDFLRRRLWPSDAAVDVLTVADSPRSLVQNPMRATDIEMTPTTTAATPTPPLPDGWVQANDGKGNVYYTNKTTGASSLERPV